MVRLLYLAPLLLLPAALAAEDAGAAKSRKFLLTYAPTVSGLQPGQTARIWLPVPPTNDEQLVETVKFEAPGSQPKLEQEKRLGNRMYYIEAKADAEGKIPVSATYRVTRKEVRGSSKSDAKPEMYLKADAKVPIDGKPLTLIKDKQLPKDQKQMGQALYDIVFGHMRYSKEGTGWGQGDSVWACDSKYGNCSDFHSLFISLARSQGMPARFEMGYSVPEKRGQGDIAGYHCWAWFKPDKGDWVPVDISEASKDPSKKSYYFGNLNENRVAFTAGRDLVLAPAQAGPPLNFFIHPYVEVDGKPLPADKVKNKVSYVDQ